MKDIGPFDPLTPAQFQFQVTRLVSGREHLSVAEDAVMAIMGSAHAGHLRGDLIASRDMVRATRQVLLVLTERLRIIAPRSLADVVEGQRKDET